MPQHRAGHYSPWHLARLLRISRTRPGKWARAGLIEGEWRDDSRYGRIFRMSKDQVAKAKQAYLAEKSTFDDYRWMKTNEAAEYAGIPITSIKNYMRSGILHPKVLRFYDMYAFWDCEINHLRTIIKRVRKQRAGLARLYISRRELFDQMRAACGQCDACRHIEFTEDRL